jgi:hypothetical protein
MRPSNFLAYLGFCFCLISFLPDSERSEACQNPEYIKDGKALILQSLAYKLFKVNIQMMKRGSRLIMFETYIFIIYF